MLALAAQPASAVSLKFEEVRPVLGFEPHTVQVGDVDGDGVLDLVLSGAPEGAAVLPGNGDGTFGGPVITPSDTGVDGVGDVNADGRADLAIARSDGVRVRLGQPDGTFGEPATFPISSDPDSVPVPSGIAVGDLDGDGDGDLVVAIGLRDDGGSFLVSGTTVSVLSSNGDGTFGTPSEFAANQAPRHVAVADLDEDGRLDVVVANDPRTAARKTLSVLPGDGDGTLSEPQPVPLFDFRQDFATAAMVVADLNRDGHRDVAVVRAGGGSSTPRGEVLFGNGNGTFNPIRPFWMSDFGLATGDFNGDGLGDLVTSALWIRMQKGVPYQFSDDIYDLQDTSRQSHVGNGLFGLPENHLPSSLFTQRGPDRGRRLRRGRPR